MISRIIIKVVNRVIGAIEEIGLEYAIFGGLALQVWKRLRSTLDIDIMALTGKQDARTLIDALLKKGLKLDEKKPKVNLGEIILIRFTYSDEESLLDIKVDVAIAGGGFSEQAVRNRVKLNVFGKDMWFVKCEDLILFKILSNRPIDIADAQELFRLNKQTIDMEYLREQAAGLKISRQLRGIEN